MKKRIRILAIVCLLLVLVTFVINAISCSMAEDIHYRCFNAIDDFSRLESYVTKELQIEDDRYIHDLIPVSSYTKEIVYEGNRYRIFAYIFETPQDTLTYFHQETGVDTVEEQGFLSSTGMFRSTVTVYSNNCLYRVEGGMVHRFNKAVNFINRSFSNTVDGSV